MVSLPLKNFTVAWCLTYCLGNFRGVQVDVSRSFGDYILIDHAVDRSLCRKSVRERKFGVVSPVRCGELGCDGDYFSRTVGCVGEFIDR